MASGIASNAKTSRDWRSKKVKEGFKRIVLWLPPALLVPVNAYAEDKEVPLSVAVEMVVKDRFLGDDVK